MFGIRSFLFWYLTFVLLLQASSVSVSNAINAAVDKVKDVLNLHGKPCEIAEPPLYLTKNENVVFDFRMIKIPDEEKFCKAQQGDGRRIQSIAEETYHFYNIEDIKSTMIAFFEDFASILFSRGEENIAENLKEMLVTVPVITKEDMAKEFKKRENDYFYSRNPQEISSAAYKTTGMPLTFYTIPEIETNRKYRKLINYFNYVLWITYTIYEQRVYPYENGVQREIKNRQLRGFLSGNSFMKLIIIYNNSNSKKIIMPLLEGANLPELQTTIDNFVNRIVGMTPKLPTYSTHYVTVQGNTMKLKKLLKKAKSRFDSLTFYYQKIEAAEKFLNVVSNVIESSITFELAWEIFEIFINNFDAFYFVLESGNLYPSANESPTIYRKFSYEDMETDNYNILDDEDEDIEEEEEEEIDETEKHVLDGKQPFRDFTNLILNKVNRNTEEIKEALIKFLHSLCSVLFEQTGVCDSENNDEKSCEEETCHPMVHEMDRVKTYIKIDAGVDIIIPKKQCSITPKECFPIDKSRYGMYFHKLTEMQGLFIAIIDYMLLTLERKIFVKNIQQNSAPDLIKSAKMEKLLEENTLATAFISQKYKEMLLNYFNPKLKKSFKLMKSIKRKIIMENKNSATVHNISDGDEDDSSKMNEDSEDENAKENGGLS